MNSLHFDQKTFRLFGFQIDARDFYTFSERWLFSTNHKYIGAELLGLALSVIMRMELAFPRLNNISLYTSSIISHAVLVCATLSFFSEIAVCQEWSASIGLVMFFNRQPKLITYLILWLSLGVSLLNSYSTYHLVLFVAISLAWVYDYLFEILLLEKTLISFVAFALNMSILGAYFIGTWCLVNGINDPIYVNNLSIFSQYRYLILSVVIVLAGVFLLLNRSFNLMIPSTFTYLVFPSLKEEAYKILYVWHTSLFAPFFTYLLGLLKNNAKLLVIYCLGHFLIFSLPRIIVVMLLIKFTFLNGDLRELFYFTPIMLIVFISSFLDYYFRKFFEESNEYLNKLLLVQSDVSVDDYAQFFNIAKIKISDFNFKFSECAFSEGYRTEVELRCLSRLWFQYGKVQAFLNLYYRCIGIIALCLIICQFFCWVAISTYYFGNFLMCNPPFIFCALTRRPFLTAGLPKRFPPSAIYSVHPHFQKELEVETSGAYKAGHLIVADSDITSPDNPLTFRFEGTVTHGKGVSAYPGLHLAPVDAQGNITQQNIVYPQFGYSFYGVKYLKHKLPGSEQYMATYRVNHIKNMPLEENT